MMKLTASLLGCLAFVVACDDDHDHDEHSHAEPITLNFAAQVGDEAFACGHEYVVGSAGTTVSPLDFRFYVHDVRLVDADGTEWPVTLEQDGIWQYEDVALLDFEDKTGACENGTSERRSTVVGTYDTGHEELTFTGVRFKVGVPFRLNHDDVATAPSPLNLSGLFWSWQGGHKFMRIDLTSMSDAEVPTPIGFNLHLGSTGCTLDDTTQAVTSCGAANRPEVALDDFDPETSTIVIDLAALVAGVDVAADAGGAPGCMSGATDPECQAVFDHLGLDLATGAAKAGQTGFRLE